MKLKNEEHQQFLLQALAHISVGWGHLEIALEVKKEIEHAELEQMEERPYQVETVKAAPNSERSTKTVSPGSR